MAKATIADNANLSRWGGAVLGFTLLCYLANVFLGMLNQDEGWYLYAARLVMEGSVPHRDFFFTQGTVMPVVYACLGWCWSSLGVLGGRLLTAGFSIVALWIASRTLERDCGTSLSRQVSRIIFFALLGINLWYTYFTTIPKAYGICTLLMALGWWNLSRIQHGPRVRIVSVVLSGICFALLANIRFSMGILLPVVMGWLFWHRQWLGRWMWFYFAVAAGGLLTALLLPELIFWPQQFWEACQFHGAREPIGIVGMIGAIARLIRFNPLLILLTLLLGWQWMKTSRIEASVTAQGVAFPQLWGVAAVALIVVHLLAPVPYDDYCVPALLPLGMAVACLCAQLTDETTRIGLTKGVVLGALALTVCASPIAQDWMVWGQDRFWVIFKAEPDLFALRRVGAQIRQAAERLNTKTLWTQDTYLAVEAGLHVPAGMEMGPFSKPQSLSFEPLLAAWSGYTFALEYPSLKPSPLRAQQLEALQTVYTHHLLEEPVFGQGGTSLTIAERTMP